MIVFLWNYAVVMHVYLEKLCIKSGVCQSEDGDLWVITSEFTYILITYILILDLITLITFQSFSGNF